MSFYIHYNYRTDNFPIDQWKCIYETALCPQLSGYKSFGFALSIICAFRVMLLSVIPEKRHLIQHERWKINITRDYCTQYLQYMESLMLNGPDNAFTFKYFEERLLSQSTSSNSTSNSNNNEQRKAKVQVIISTNVRKEASTSATSLKPAAAKPTTTSSSSDTRRSPNEKPAAAKPTTTSSSSDTRRSPNERPAAAKPTTTSSSSDTRRSPNEKPAAAKPATSRPYIPVHTGSESEPESDSDDEDPQYGPKRKRGKPRNNKAQKKQKTGRQSGTP